MSVHARHAAYQAAERQWWPRAALAAALCAALCVVLLAAAHPAGAEPAVGSFAWPTPWLTGSVDANYVTSLVPGPSGAIYAAGNTAYGQSSSTAFVARIRTSDGRQRWLKPRPGMYLAAAAGDSSRNVILAGSKGGDIAVAKYRPDGTLAWVTRWGSSTLRETAVSVTVAPDGSVYVAGVRMRSATGKDAVIVALSPGGHVRWRHLTATSGDDVPEALTTDAAGNVYVTGGRAASATDSRWTTYKLSPGGTRLWMFNVTFSRLGAKEFGWGRWLRVNDNALYVAAQRGTSADGLFATMKLSLKGAERWLRQSYTLPGPAVLQGATVDGSGRLYLVGSIQPSSSPGITQLGELLVTRADGVMAWHDEFEDPLGPFSTGFSRVSVDSLGRPSCSGMMATTGGGNNYAAVVVRYQADAGLDTIWRWDGGVGGGNAFGPLLRVGALYAGGQVTTAMADRAIVERLK